MGLVGVLPEHFREALKRAAQVDITFDPLARVKAINRVIRKARAEHPELFQPDEQEVDDDRASGAPVGPTR